MGADRQLGRRRGSAPHRRRGDRSRAGRQVLSPRAAWRWCALAGIVTTVASTAFGWIAGLTPCGPTGGLGSIIAFELARSPVEVASIFGTGTCRETLIAAQIKALWLDGLAFIPSYTAFLALAAFALRHPAPRLARAAILIILGAGLLDEIEGGLLYAILRDLPGSPTLIALLYGEVRAKFALLALGALLIGWLMVRDRRPGMVVAVPVIGGSLFSGALIATNMHAPALMQGYRWSWTALLVAALIGSFWPRAFSRAP
jgi:hypothetical protein